jgi:RNA polymerase sigma-70 factor, ECF subfamily
LSDSPSSPPAERQAQLMALADELRPELHRYCAPLMGSVIGEDVVQDTFARAFVALDELQETPPLRAWLFRIAHNRAHASEAGNRRDEPNRPPPDLGPVPSFALCS